MRSPVAATVATPRYASRLAVLAETLERFHPEMELHALLLGDGAAWAQLPPSVEAFTLADLDPALPESVRFRYDEESLACALRARLLLQVGVRTGAEVMVYLDADTWLEAPLDPAIEALERAALAVTPHLSRPPATAAVSPAALLRHSGLWTSGFFAFRNEPSVLAFLEFWKRQLDRASVRDPWLGILHDLSWFDFAPCFVESTAILRDPALHLGFWNAGDGELEKGDTGWRFDGRPVRLAHASGFDATQPAAISCHLPPELRPRLAPFARLLAEYAARLRRAEPAAAAAPPLAERFRGRDVAIAPFLRAHLGVVDPHGERFPDPYDAARPDGYFAYLAAPLATARGELNRAALALWESRADLIHSFPDPCGADLPAFLDWLTTHGEGLRSGLDPVFLGTLRATRPGPAAEAATAAYHLDPGRLLLARARRDGATASYLAEAVGAGNGAESLPRSLLLLHRARPELQRRFPDPAGADRAAFLAWAQSGEPG